MGQVSTVNTINYVGRYLRKKRAMRSWYNYLTAAFSSFWPTQVPAFPYTAAVSKPSSH